MDFQDFKLYGLCVMRLKHQIRLAREQDRMCCGRAVLESFCTGDIEDIVDLLELYDLKVRTRMGLDAMLTELAEDASLFVQESLAFDYDESGDLCLFLVEKVEATTENINVASGTDAIGARG